VDERPLRVLVVVLQRVLRFRREAALQLQTDVASHLELLLSHSRKAITIECAGKQ
jgi:hypothetical protein